MQQYCPLNPSYFLCKFDTRLLFDTHYKMSVFHSNTSAANDIGDPVSHHHDVNSDFQHKRDRDDRDAMVKEREEIERVRNMTEEERREWERRNPKPTRAQKQK
ncbi:putative micro-fibrillar-associated protein [Helianthus annuus]|nr:putative micro-fibrillar-associated protein [Helianthus annuus]